MLNDNEKHLQFFQADDEDILFYGSAGSGKSYSVCHKILLTPFLENVSIRTVVIRKTLPRLKSTCIDLFVKQAERFQIPFRLNKQDYIAKYGAGYENEIFFVSVNNTEDYEKVKSLTDIDIIWVEEATEITETAFERFIRPRLRGGTRKVRQCILTFNPMGKSNWVFKNYFEKQIREHLKIHARPFDNKFIEPEYVEYLKSLEKYQPEAFKMYYLGEWIEEDGSVFKMEDLNMVNIRKVDFLGSPIMAYVDWGFTNDKTVLVIGRQSYIDGMIYVEHVLRYNGSPDEIIEYVANACVNHKVSVLGAEANFRQEDDVKKVETALRLKGYNGGVKRVHNHIHKDKRIRIIQPIMKQYVFFRDDWEDIKDYRDFIYELIAYGNWENVKKKDIHDDDADSLEGFISNMFTNYGVPRKYYQDLPLRSLGDSHLQGIRLEDF